MMADPYKFSAGDMPDIPSYQHAPITGSPYTGFDERPDDPLGEGYRKEDTQDFAVHGITNLQNNLNDFAVGRIPDALTPSELTNVFEHGGTKSFWTQQGDGTWKKNIEYHKVSDLTDAIYKYHEMRANGADRASLVAYNNYLNRLGINMEPINNPASYRPFLDQYSFQSSDKYGLDKDYIRDTLIHEAIHRWAVDEADRKFPRSSVMFDDPKSRQQMRDGIAFPDNFFDPIYKPKFTDRIFNRELVKDLSNPNSTARHDNQYSELQADLGVLIDRILRKDDADSRLILGVNGRRFTEAEYRQITNRLWTEWNKQLKSQQNGGSPTSSVFRTIGRLLPNYDRITGELLPNKGRNFFEDTRIRDMVNHLAQQMVKDTVVHGDRLAVENAKPIDPAEVTRWKGSEVEAT